jgi:hypothetical protein
VISQRTGYLASGPVPGGTGDILKSIVTYAKAFMTDPGTAFNYLLNKQTIVRTVGGGLIVQRAGVKDTQSLINSRGGSTQNGVPMQLDHVIPLELGGSNAVSNLSLITKAQDDANNAMENSLAQKLNSGQISMKDAQAQILAYKAGQKGVDNGTNKKLSQAAKAAQANPGAVGTGNIKISKTGGASLASPPKTPKLKLTTATKKVSARKVAVAKPKLAAVGRAPKAVTIPKAPRVKLAKTPVLKGIKVARPGRSSKKLSLTA